MLTEGFISLIVTSFVISFGAVVSPGPVSAAIISETPRRGWIVGPLVALGHTALELVMIVVIGLGLTTDLSAGLLRGISIAGGLVLLAIGASYIRSAADADATVMDLDNAEQDRRSSTLSLIGLGMATTLSNPFWYVWWFTVVVGIFADRGETGAGAMVVFYLAHISVDFAWDTLLALLGAGGSRWMSRNAYRILIGVTGAFMAYIGVTFLLP